MKMKEYLSLHTKNRRKVQIAISHLTRALNTAIRRHEQDSIYVHARCLIILWVALYENSMDCVLHSANKITFQERRDIIALPSLNLQWIRLLEICFTKYYQRPSTSGLSKLSLGATNFLRYTEVRKILETDVAGVIEIRNRLAHGEWHIALNSDGTDKRQDLTTQIWKLGKKDVMYCEVLFKNIIELLNDLACSSNIFEKHFDKAMRIIEEFRVHGQKQYEFRMKWFAKMQKNKERLGYF